MFYTGYPLLSDIFRLKFNYSLFSEEDMTRDQESEKSQAEGTSLVHMSYAVKHDLVSVEYPTM